MNIYIKQIITEMEKLAPPFLACDWDNSGLQVGNINQEVRKTLLTLDITEEVLKEAITKGCNLIIAHHPLLFKGVKSINNQTENGRIIIKAIKNNITIYAAHTNLDIAAGGLNDYLASMLRIQQKKPLDITNSKKYYKLVIYIPEEHFHEVKESILEKGAGKAGNYSYSSFFTRGTGTFKPLSGSAPYRGKEKEFCSVDEVQFSTIVAEDILNEVLDTLYNVHPYEEIAYDLFPLSNKIQEYGIGRIGNLKGEMSLQEFIKMVKKILDVEKIKIAGPFTKKIKKVALCTGAGGDYIKTARDNGADLYLTGEAKYHDAQLAEELGLILLNAGHFSTEVIVKELLLDYLENRFKSIEIMKSEVNTNPWQEM